MSCADCPARIVLRYSNGLTERLYYHDSYLWTFEATVRQRSENGLRLVLDRTAFYPSSGGQPHDLGTLGECRVLDVTEDGDEIVHILESSWPLGLDHATGVVQVQRRLDHMQQHTGQHLLSAVMAEEFSLTTVSFHLGAEVSTVDVEPSTVSAATLLEIESRVNERVRENLSARVSFEDAATAQGLRKETDREGIIRVVSIDGLDRSACGGTHLKQTGEIGSILLGGTEKVRKALRIEFYCGGRVLTQVRKCLASETELRIRLAEAEKARKKLGLEVAEGAGQHRFDQLPVGADGRVLWVEEFAQVDDLLRTSAIAFVANPGAIAVLTGRDGNTLLFAAHPSVGIDCGKRLKPLVDEAGGRGGGSARMAQGSVPDAAALAAVIEKLLVQ